MGRGNGGFKPGDRQPKKPTTAKNAMKRLDALERAVQGMYFQFAQQLTAFRKEIANLEQNNRLIDCRSLATYRMLRDNLDFTEEAHNDIVSEVQEEIFNQFNETENEQMDLISVDTPAEDGLRVVFQLDAYEVGEDGARGDKIEDLSAFRSKVILGGGEFFDEIEKEIVGMKPQDIKEFTLTMPERFGQYADKEVIYEVNLLQVLKSEQPEAEKTA